MRSLSSPRQQPKTASTPAAESDITNPAPASPAAESDTSSPVLTYCRPEEEPILAEFERENRKLRQDLTLANEQLKCVLDHSIESDSRLLEFTDQIFVANTNTQPPRVTKTDSAVQCDPLTVSCQDLRCAENRDLVTSLRTTIEVLEAEIEALRAEVNNCDQRDEAQTLDEWTVCHNKRNPPPKLQTSNTFNTLDEKTKALHSNRNGKHKSNNKKNTAPEKIFHKHSNKSNNNNPKPEASKTKPKKFQMSFTSILIEGDSHTRGLAAIVQEQVTPAVSGVCKPNAKLCAVMSSALPPPESCYVLLAGTNDIAAGEPQNIFRHLEQRVVARLESAAVVVATLPHRHDLPAGHPVNQQISLVNSFIGTMCSRLHGAFLLDFNVICRRWFTNHGMHLRLPGKRLLAKQLLRCLMEANRSRAAPQQPVSSPPGTQRPLASPSRHQPQPIPTRSSPGSSPRYLPTSTPSLDISTPTATLEVSNIASAAPRELPYDTFADAVKSSPTKCCNDNGPSTAQKNCSVKKNLKTS